MKTYFDCIPCFLRQTLDTARFLGLEDEETGALLNQTLALAQQLDWSLPPPVTGREIHRAIRGMTGDADPYLSRKMDDTSVALKFLPMVEKKVLSSSNPFLDAVRFSIAGNAIDLGAKSYVDTDVENSFNMALTKTVDEKAINNLKRAVSDAESVLFLADNAGEIVFDRPFLEQIGREKVTVAVRGGPVINDATLDDAARSGLTKQFRVISNGSDAPGTWLPDCSKAFVDQFENASLVIAKGQGNYETLNDSTRGIVFLFIAKCPVLSQELGVDQGTYVVRETK
jgi:damage-control phosphatase, subfamily I